MTTLTVAFRSYFAKAPKTSARMTYVISYLHKVKRGRLRGNGSFAVIPECASKGREEVYMPGARL